MRFFGIPHLAFTSRKANARKARTANTSFPKPTRIRPDMDQKDPVVGAEERRKTRNKRKATRPNRIKRSLGR